MNRGLHSVCMMMIDRTGKEKCYEVEECDENENGSKFEKMSLQMGHVRTVITTT